MEVIRAGGLSTHSDQLERWLGPEVHRISAAMKDWYGPPIAVGSTPGAVFAVKGGDFRGPIKAGQLTSALDYGAARLRRFARSQMRTANAGFTGLSDLISEASASSKRVEFQFAKAGPTGVVNVTSTLWNVGATPATGAAGSAAPGGRACTSATVGAHPFTNPTGGDTLHLVNAYSLGSVAGTLLLYDRIFDVAKTMNSSGTEAVTGVPSRYQSTTATAANYGGGNFLFLEIGTVLAATPHNWTACIYTDEAGNGSAALPSLTGNSGGIAGRLDHPAGQWFAPLATGDIGVQQLDQMQCSAAVATGTINFVIGHPLMWMPTPFVNCMCQHDGINTAFNLVRVFDDACLSLLDVLKTATTATNWNAHVSAVFG